MKIEYGLFLILTVTGGCSREDSQSSNIQINDSVKLGSRHKELENVIRDYYLSIEDDVKMDLGVSEAEIIERVQSLIDSGYVQRPAILIITGEGPRWVSVDYPTYKEFMTDYAITSRKFHGVQPNILDTLAMDSIRSILLKALKADSVH